MAKGSDLLVAALENEGVTRIFGVPGDKNLDVVESLRRSTRALTQTSTAPTSMVAGGTS
jgi:acetolactate synthase-1/2/3 large subunit